MIDHATEPPHRRMPPDDKPQSERPHHGDARNEKPQGSAAELFAPLMAHLGELFEYATYYFSAQTDLVWAKVRKLVLYAVLGLIAAVIGLTTLVVAVTFTLLGIAGGLGELITQRPWAGYLTTGAVILAVGFGTLRLFVPNWLTISRTKIKEKYDRRRQTQRTRYGHDVDEIRKN